MKPSIWNRDRTRAERAEREEEQRTQLRTLVDRHAALGREFHALHEQAVAVQHQDVSRVERRAQIDVLLRAEGEVLAQAEHVRQVLQRLVTAQYRHLP